MEKPSNINQNIKIEYNQNRKTEQPFTSMLLLRKTFMQK